jgi:acyl-CoA dehydrogenase
MTEYMTVAPMPTDADLDELRTLARSIFQKPASETLNVQQTAIPFDESLWKTLAASGLTLLSTPERAGGSGAGIAEAAAVLSVAGEYAAPVPVAETDLLAAWLLVLAGRDVPTGPLSSGTGAVSISDGPGAGLTVRGSLDRVPWAREAEAIVVLGRTADRDVVFSLPSDRFTFTEGYNLAHEPRNCVTFDVELPTEAVVTVEEGVALEWVLRGALARTAQTCGALESALTLTIGHASERMQFGRHLSKFQAVQHMIARAAGEVSIAQAALDVAVRAAVHHGMCSPHAELAVAIAKTQAARASGVVSKVCHQVHGAIGFTLDHQLRHFTLRSLAWRSEFGDERYWERRIGQLALEAGAEGVWELITTGQPPVRG